VCVCVCVCVCGGGINGQIVVVLVLHTAFLLSKYTQSLLNYMSLNCTFLINFSSLFIYLSLFMFLVG
jgi:hypothetical protein